MIAVSGGFVAGVKRGGRGGVLFTVPGSDGMMLFFLGLACVSDWCLGWEAADA